MTELKFLYFSFNEVTLSYLGVKLNQIEEDDILPLSPDGRVERELSLCLKHLVQQRCWHVLKVFTGKIIL